MSNSEKIICSRRLANVDRGGSHLVNDIHEELLNLINRKNMMIFSCAGLSKTLIKLRLIDQLRLMVNLVVLGKGKPLFKRIKGALKLHLLKVKMFNSGNMLPYYRPLYN